MKLSQFLLALAGGVIASAAGACPDATADGSGDALTNAPSIEVTASPDSERLPQTGVPFLHEEVTEAVSREDGLWIEPAEPFTWSKVGPTDEPFSLALTMDETRFEEVVLTLWNWHNHPIGQWRFPAGEPVELRLRVERLGVYQLTLDGYYAGECRARLVRSVAVTEDLSGARDTWRDEEFFLGICGFPGRYHWRHRGEATLPRGLGETGARRIEAELLARLGFQVARVDESKEMGPPLPGGSGEYRFSFDRMDAAVAAYTSRGFDLALQLMHAPDWAIEEDYAHIEENRWRYPHREKPQRAYTRALVKRYGEEARFIQVFNEPDQADFWAGTPEEFLEHFRFSLDEIRRHAPGVPVANGGYSLVDPERTRFFIERLRGQIDLPAYHSHGDLPSLREDFSRIRTMHEEAGYESPRFINTEMGFDGWRLDQEWRKGQNVPQKTLFCWGNDHAGVLLFSGRMTFGPTRSKQDFGFLDHFFCPRYVYGSTAALVTALRGARFERKWRETDELFVYEFRRGDQSILAGFSLGSKVAVPLRIGEGRVVEAIDEMGNRSAGPASPDESGQVSWELEGYPRYLIVDGEFEVGRGGDFAE